MVLKDFLGIMSYHTIKRVFFQAEKTLKYLQISVNIKQTAL